MKLWVKIYIITLLLFTATFYGGIFIMSSLSYRANLDIIRKQAFSEYDFIASVMAGDLDAILQREPANHKQALTSLMLSTLGFYQKQAITLQLFLENEPLMGQAPDEQYHLFLQDAAEAPYAVVHNGTNQKELLIASQLREGYTLLYSRNITYLDESQRQLTRRLMIVCAVIDIIFMIVLFLLLRKLTNPIHTLRQVTRRIAEGEYAQRAQVKGHDEVAQLAADFNNMAEKMVSHMEEQKCISLQKQQFIDNLAHELKTPLTTISGYAEFICHANLSEEESLDAATHILQDVKRIQSMSHKLLELAMMRDKALEGHHIYLDELFGEIRQLFALRLKEKQLSLICPSTNAVIFGDRELLINLFSNLLDNSIKASQHGGSIYLSAHSQGNSVEVEVIDEGTGMDKQHLERVFEPFYRIDYARSSSTGSGAGLGLALCRQIAGLHNADITIQSVPKQGTKVTIVFTTPS